MFLSLVFSALVEAEGFSSFFFDHIGRSKNGCIAVMCSDSFSLDKKELKCEISNFGFSQKSSEMSYAVLQNGRWKISQKSQPAKLNVQDQSFVDFIFQFAKDRDFQVSRTVFPLPISYLEPQSATAKKKLVMPRDWVDLGFSSRCSSLYVLQSGRVANNRKIYIFQNGKKKEFYNFIYINRNWYLIEMELY